MTPEQTAQQLKQELGINERIGKLLQEHAKHVADDFYRKSSTAVDHATLLRLTGAAAAIEGFVAKLLTLRTEK